MKLFEILDDILQGKKFHNKKRCLPFPDEWLEYDKNSNCIKMCSNKYKFTPNIYNIEFNDLLTNDWVIIID